MEESTQEQTTTTTEAGVTKTIVKPGESTETETTETTAASAIDDPKVQAEIDRRVTQAVATATRKAADKAAADKAEADRIAAEQKIREEGDIKKLAKLHEKEANELRAELAKVKRDKDVMGLLDTALITDPTERKILSNQRFDSLDQLADIINEFKDSRQPALEAAIAAKLDTGGTPPQTREKPARQGDLHAQLRAAEAEGPKGRKEATRIRNLIADENSRRASLMR
jgi:hypothetical protein